MNSIAIVYLPVLHKGYFDFFRSLVGKVSTVWVLGEQLIKESDYLHKEIRALDPKQAVDLVRSLNLPFAVSLLEDGDGCREIALSYPTVYFPEEDVCRLLVDKYFNLCPQQSLPVFLRWDRRNTLLEREPQNDRRISFEVLDREIMGKAYRAARLSSDWWRQVGAVMTTPAGEVLCVAYNHHLPSLHTPYINGDPRNCLHKGEGIELSSAAHAEASVIQWAARQTGVSTVGNYLYVTTFPCPPCAIGVAGCGFARLYYSEGYAMLDGEEILKQAGVEIIQVSMPLPQGP